MIKRICEKYKKIPIQVRASIWFLTCSFFQKAISVISTPIFTRLLSNDEYGKFSVYTSWQSIIGIFVTLNLFCGVYTSGLVKFKENRAEFISAMEGLTTVLSVVGFVIYLMFSAFFNKLFLLTTFQMCAMIIQLWTSAIFSFWAAEQRVEYAYRGLIRVTVITSILKPLIGVILVITCKDKVTARIVGLALVEVVCFSWMFIKQIRRCKNLFSSFFWKYAIKFNVPLIPHYLAQNILSSSDRIMISRMVDDKSAGIYSLAYSISLIMNLFNTALTQTLSPWVYEKIKNREEKDIEKTVSIAIILIATVNIILIIFAPEIVKMFAPVSYYDAVWVIPPITMSVYFTFLYDIFSYYEFYFEKTKFIAIATMMASVLNMLLNFICIKVWGYRAAGYTTLICYVLYSVGHYFVMCNVANENLNGNRIINAKKLLMISLSFMIVGFVFCALYNYTALRYMLAIVILMLVFLYHKKIVSLVIKNMVAL